jgi:hypothetical protein
MSPNAPRALLGDWSPGIGDPTPIGWLTVVAYFVAALACFSARRRTVAAGAGLASNWSRRASATLRLERRAARLWLGLGVFLVALGINKQLDLQTALTELGRTLALARGWYARRREVQSEFIAGVSVGALAAGVALAFVARGQLRRFGMALTGAVFLLAFVLVRASSFHHVDALIHTRLLGLQVNWLLELSGIALIGLAAKGDRPGVAFHIEPRRPEGRLL